MKFTRNKIIFLNIGIIAILLVLIFAYLFVAPFGAKITYQFTSDKNSDKASGLIGANKSGAIETNVVNSLIIPQQIIRNSIVTFNLKLLSQKIDGIWVNLKFKGNPKEIKIGVRGSEKEKYQYLPLYNQILNSLSWNQTTNKDATFWQREKKYQDIAGLVSKPPVSEDINIASYFVNLSDIAVKESKSITQDNLKIEKTLRGSHTLLVKIDKKPFLLTVIKQDANLYKGEDVLSIKIYNDQNKIAEQIIPDDGVTAAGGLAMAPQKSEIKINDIKPGVYKIVLNDMTENADTRIKSIEINQSTLVFQTLVFVVDEKPTELWTNSKKITLRTAHAVSIQTVKLDNKYNLKVQKENQDFEFDLNNPDLKIATSSAESIPIIHKLEIPKNDLGISGDGSFAFSEKSFFNPEPVKTVDLSTVTDMSKINYIIAHYQPAKKEGDWYTAQAYFDPKDLKIDGNKLYFSLESPDLQSYGGEIAMDNLEVTVDKPGWFGNPVPIATAMKKSERFLDKIANFFKNLWPFGKKEEVKPTPKPKPTNTPTPTPTPTQALKDKLKISVQNGGGTVGIAAKYANLLKKAGFKNVESGNSPTAYKNATISINKDEETEIKSTITEIKKILGEDYRVLDELKTAEKGKIEIILGELPKPTITASPSATIKP